IHLPTLRIAGGKVRADLAHTHPVPKIQRTGHTVALGVDWGLNTLLSAGAARLHDEGQITDVGAGAQFRAAGVLAKQYRLRRISERLHAKTDHYDRLADPSLDGRAARLAEEIRRVSARRSNLNDALAWSAARWTVDQAVAAGATVIYLEDLRSMEAGGMGRTQNTRLSQTVRGQITDHVRHLAAEVGIAVVTVPPRNTSKHCPACLTPLRHRKAPDRPTVPGWKWAICPGCGWQGDRDQGAWRRIAARGLAHQTKTVVDRTSGAMVIHAVVDAMEAKSVITATPKTHRTDRSKTGPTRPRTNRLTPGRREVPSPTRPLGRAGQRPEGHAPTDRTRLPRAAHRHQNVTTISTHTTSRHRPRGAALGAGFHLHAHASPPRWAEPTPDPTVRIGSLSYSETLVVAPPLSKLEPSPSASKRGGHTKGIKRTFFTSRFQLLGRHRSQAGGRFTTCDSILTGDWSCVLPNGLRPLLRASPSAAPPHRPSPRRPPRRKQSLTAATATAVMATTAVTAATDAATTDTEVTTTAVGTRGRL
ncbi:zinc ribbon domain-containing protein, partial [Streptomyces carpinensis]|uniref:zinc ribbon domain-containing protein n=1 Tax=Streptomyces carpinensis TaxID=66369 RepID=UPI001FC9B66F